MSKRKGTQAFVPRSRLATIAHRMVLRANSEKDAAERIVEELQVNEGIEAELEVAEVNGENHWVAIIPTEQTNYDESARNVAVVPDMSVSKDFTQDHVGVVTPEEGKR